MSLGAWGGKGRRGRAREGEARPAQAVGWPDPLLRFFSYFFFSSMGVMGGIFIYDNI